MRTRRSPRNQMILWRDLGGKTVAPKRIKGPLPSKADVIAARWGINQPKEPQSPIATSKD